MNDNHLFLILLIIQDETRINPRFAKKYVLAYFQRIISALKYSLTEVLHNSTSIFFKLRVGEKVNTSAHTLNI
jgi:hypothetical protein